MSLKTEAKPEAPGRRNRKWSLGLRLTVFYTATTTLLLVAASVLVYYSVATYLEQDDDRRLQAKMHEIEAILARDGPDLDVSLRQAVGMEYVAESLEPFLIRIKDDRGNVLVATPRMEHTLPVGSFVNRRHPTASPDDRPYVLVAPSGRVFRARSLDVPTSPYGNVIIHGAVDHEPEMRLLARYRRTLWVVNALGLLGSGLVGYWIALRGLRPLDDMGRAVLQISSSTLNQRLASEEYPAEISRLASRFNVMLQGLEDAFVRLSRYSADIAHELRTPINNVRGEAEVALGRARTEEEYREVLGSCLEECQRLSTLIDSLLFIARVENPAMQIKRENIGVRAELEAIVEFYEAPAADVDISISYSATEDLIFQGDRHLFRRAIGNLVENAIKYSAAGGQVSITAEKQNGTLSVAVSDTGRGIPPEHVPHIFDRFYRVDVDRSKETGGSGLGLAIVKTIASLHEGEVVVESQLGRGTTVKLLFPDKRVGGQRDGARANPARV